MSDSFDHKGFARAISTEYGREIGEAMFNWLMEYSFCARGASPIETMLGCALVLELRDRIDATGGVEDAGMGTDDDLKFEDFIVPPFEGFTAGYQVKIGAYTVDFLIARRSLEYGTAYFAIECDGHEFHERTKKQAQHDKARDRFLQSKGISVLRFTGSEVWRDPRGTALSILNDIDEAMKNRHEAR